MPPRPDPSIQGVNLRLWNRGIFISDFKSLHMSAHLSCPRVNSLSAYFFRIFFTMFCSSVQSIWWDGFSLKKSDDRPERAQPLLPRMNLAIREKRYVPGQIIKKVMKFTGRPQHYIDNCAQRKFVDPCFSTNSLRQGEISRPSADRPLSQFPIVAKFLDVFASRRHVLQNSKKRVFLSKTASSYFLYNWTQKVKKIPPK